MQDQATIDSVGKKFQDWAQSLAPAEQEVLAEWWSNRSEVSGYAANWWAEPNAWQSTWQSWWSE
jgi:hypothetical protein